MLVPTTSPLPTPPSMARSTTSSKDPRLEGPDITMVAIGDSLTQGTQDATTIQDRQAHCYVKQLADHAGLSFNMAYMDGEGIPFNIFHDHTFDSHHFYSHLIKLGLAVAPLALYTYFVGVPDNVIPTWDVVPHMGKRTEASKNTPEHPQSDFAVCGYTMRHLSNVANVQDYLEEIHEGLTSVHDVGVEVPLVRATLGNGESDGDGTAVDQALQRNPDLIVAWAGNNDALSSVFNGRLDDAILTPVEDKKWEYQVSNPITGSTHEVVTDRVMPGFRSQVLGENGLIDRLLKGSHADVMLFNIPDVTVVALAKEVGKPVGKLPFKVLLNGGDDVTDQLENWVIPDTIKGKGHGGRKTFPPGTRVSLSTVLHNLILHGAPQTKDELHAILTPHRDDGFLGEDDVLDPEELTTVQHRIQDFNGILAEAAQKSPRVHLVDIHAVLDDTAKHGHQLRGDGPEEWVCASYTGAPDIQGRDGIFSYDGVHPSDTGHALVANVLLDTIKRDLGDNPRFARFRNLPPLDEKQVHHADPHATGKAVTSIILDEHHVDELNRSLI